MLPHWTLDTSAGTKRTAGPHVDAVSVLRAAEQDLGGAVPAGGDVVCQDGAGPVVRRQLRHGPRQPEVRQLDLALAVEQQVAGLRRQRKAVAGSAG